MLVEQYKRYPPLIVTFQELRSILEPLTVGYAWGESTIADLWRLGAPTPNSIIGTHGERRIVFPTQLAKWLEDVLQRQGIPLDAGTQAYLDLRKMTP